MGVFEEALKATGTDISTLQPSPKVGSDSSGKDLGVFGEALEIVNKQGGINAIYGTQSSFQTVEEEPKQSFFQGLKSVFNTVDETVDNWIDWIKNTKVGKAIGEARKKISKKSAEIIPDLTKGILLPLSFILPKPAYSPDREEGKDNINKLVKDYEKSIQGQISEAPNVFLSGFVRGITGGFIKPEYRMPDTFSARVVDMVGDVVGSVVAIQNIAGKLSALSKAPGIAQIVYKYPNQIKYISPFLKNAAALGIYGQLDPDIDHRVRRFVFDALTSTAFTSLGFIPKAKISIPASFALGFGMAKLSGASNEDAILNGAILGALDAYGRYKQWKVKFFDRERVNRILRKEAIDVLNKYSGAKLNEKAGLEAIKKAYYEASKRVHPDIIGSDAPQRAVNAAYEFLTGKRAGFPFKAKDLEVVKKEQKSKEKKMLPTPREEAGKPKTQETPPKTPTEPTETKSIPKETKTKKKPITKEQPKQKQITKEMKPEVKTEEKKFVFGWNRGVVFKSDKNKFIIQHEDTKEIVSEVGSEDEARSFFDGYRKGWVEKGKRKLSIKKAKYLLVKDYTGNILLRTDKSRPEIAKAFINGYKIGGKREVDFWHKAKPKTEVETQKTSLEKPKEIPKELEPLAKEARKYKSPEEFIENFFEKARKNGISFTGLDWDSPSGIIRYNIDFSPDERIIYSVIIDKPVNKEEYRLSILKRRPTSATLERLSEKDLDYVKLDLEKYDDKKIFNGGEEVYSSLDGVLKRIEKIIPDAKQKPLYLLKIGKPSQERLKQFYNQAVKQEKPEKQKIAKTEAEKVSDLSKQLLNRVEKYLDNLSGVKKSVLFNKKTKEAIDNLRHPWEYTPDEWAKIIDLYRKFSNRFEALRKLQKKGYELKIKEKKDLSKEDIDKIQKEIAGVIEKERSYVIDAMKRLSDKIGRFIDKFGTNHKKIVENAIEKGEEVPNRVLDEYPEIKKNIEERKETEIKPSIEKKIEEEIKDLKEMGYEAEKPKSDITYLGGGIIKDGRVIEIGEDDHSILSDIPSILNYRFARNRTDINIKIPSDFSEDQINSLIKILPNSFKFFAVDILDKNGNVVGGFVDEVGGDKERLKELVERAVYEAKGIKKEKSEIASAEKPEPQKSEVVKKIEEKIISDMPDDLLRFASVSIGKDLREMLDLFGKINKNEKEEVVEKLFETLDKYKELDLRDPEELHKFVNENKDLIRKELKKRKIIKDQKYELPPEIDELSMEKYGKLFAELKPREAKRIIRNLIKGEGYETQLVFLFDDEDFILSLTPPKKGYEEWGDLSKGISHYFSYKSAGRYITDGVYLIIDEKVAEKIRNEYYSKTQRYFEKRKIEADLSKEKTEDVREKVYPALKGVLFPFLKPIKAKKLKLQGVKFYEFDPGLNPFLIYSTGKEQVVLNGQYVSFLKKHFPNAEIYFIKEDYPVVFYQDGEIKAILMPIGVQSDGIPFKVNEFKDGKTFEGKEIKIKLKDEYIKEITQFEKKLKAPSGTASVGEFSDVESLRKKISNIPAIEFPEMVRLAKELLGKDVELVDRLGNALGYFKYSEADPDRTKKIKILRSLFKNPDTVAKVLAHEIGHLIDFLPDKRMDRGNIVGRVAVLHRYLKWRFGKLENKTLREELWKLSRMWRPFNEKEVSPSYIRYRKSSKELYADAISVLFNDPDLLKERAPMFWNGFFEYLDKKPQVEKALFELWDMMNGEEAEKLSEREKAIFEMFEKGEDKFRMKILEKHKKKTDFLYRFKKQLIDKNQALIDKLNELKKKGIKISDEENPIYYLENYNYISGKISSWLKRNIQPIYEAVQKDNISWNEFGEYLFLDRVIHERGGVRKPIDYLREIAPDKYEMYKEYLGEHLGKSTAKQLKVIEKLKEEDPEAYEDIISVLPKGLANPLGFDVHTAKRQMQYLSERLGKERFANLEEYSKKFREKLNEVLDLAKEKGYFSEDTISKLKANPHYATFQVIEYLDSYISPEIKKQVGTLKEIANPADAMIDKTMSLIKAIYRNEAKVKAINLLKNYFKDEIQPAKRRWVNKRWEYIKPKDKALELVMVKENGQWKGYYVDKEIGEVLNTRPTGELNVFVKTFQLLNSKWFRPVFITYNLGFQSFNLTRDFLRYWINRPDKSFGEAFTGFFKTFKYYVKALPHAFRRGFDKPDEIINEMEDSFILGVTYNDLIKGIEESERRIEFILSKYRKKEVKGLEKILDFIEKIGNTWETLPKVASYLEWKDKIPHTKLVKFVRQMAGSPDFLRRGSGYMTYNNIFLFSNAAKEGIRADLEMALGGIEEFGGKKSVYWFKRILANILPKILMFMAIYGLFGKKVKEIMNKVSDYNKTNYIVIPLGLDKNGKAIYLRIPQDEFGRFVGGLFWKGLMALDPKRREFVSVWRDLAEILNYGAGQIPNLTPAITIPVAIGQFLSGQNPYDFFYGRNVIPDEHFKAGGKHRLIPFAKWIFTKSGGRIFWNFRIGEFAPESESWLEKVLSMPIISDTLGRWIKVSDYGSKEKLLLMRDKLEQKNAIRRIEERNVINKYIREYLSKPPTPDRKLKIERGLINELLKDRDLDPKTRKKEVRKIIKKFNVGIARGESDVYTNMIISADTNEEKLKIIEEARKEKDIKEFRSWIGTLVRHQVISKNVLEIVKKKYFR